jgi:hypothetical protein
LYSVNVERTKNLQARYINLEILATFVFLPPGKGRFHFGVCPGKRLEEVFHESTAFTGTLFTVVLTVFETQGTRHKENAHMDKTFDDRINLGNNGSP